MSRRQTVIVTGASSGIGEATARAFGLRGDRVVVTARRMDRLQALAAQLPDALAVGADLRNRDDIARVVAETQTRFGRIDILVNNAGTGRYDWLEYRSGEEILEELQVNLVAPILLSRAVLPIMQAQGYGIIINVASAAARIGVPTMSIYNAAKFGLDGFSEGLRREVAHQGIAVCVIYPGSVAGTEFTGSRKGPAFKGGAAAWLRTDAPGVARAIVALADHPRPRRVIPPYYGVAIAVNAIAPRIVDPVLSRMARKARRGA